MFKSVKNFAHDSGLKYALIAALIALGIVASLNAITTKIQNTFSEVGGNLK